MKNLWEKIKKLAYNPYFLICSILIILFVLYLLYINWISAPEFWELVEIDKSIKLEVYSQIVRNRSWLIWMVFSLSGLAIGIGLTFWGRILQSESHIHERLEKATTMLGSEVMGRRITGCRFLMSLATDDKNMKSLCLDLLFAFINNPYLKEVDEDEGPNVLFSDTEKHLRADIQQAADSISAIYKHYKKEGVGDKRVDLPSYFWINRMKGSISLIKADLSRANLKGADLNYMDLKEANLGRADLQGINFENANLQGANLKNANLQSALLRGTILQGANLKNANLQNALLRGAVLRGANLKNANLQGARLMQIDLQQANLARANLQGKILQNIKLQGASLREANLQGVNLRMVNLQEVDFNGTDLTNVKMERVNRLRKEQILSAIWGYDGTGKGSPPELPSELADSPELQEWLKTPHYNKKEEADEREKRMEKLRKIHGKRMKKSGKSVKAKKSI